jgi:hypothetical protein
MDIDADRMAQMMVAAIETATAPLLARIQVLEQQKAYVPRDGRDGAPGPQGEKGLDGLPGKDGEPGTIGPAGKDGRDGTDGTHGPPGPAGEKGMDGRDGLPGQPGRDGERGPVGEKGLDGRDGKDGTNGRDGTIENIKVVYDGKRTVTLCLKDGTPLDGGVLVFPLVLDEGVYRPGEPYTKGSGVTWGGSFWIAQKDQPAGRPGDSSGDWRLAIKRGDVGKPGPIGPEGQQGKAGPMGPQGKPGY